MIGQNTIIRFIFIVRLKLINILTSDFIETLMLNYLIIEDTIYISLDRQGKNLYIICLHFLIPYTLYIMYKFERN